MSRGGSLTEILLPRAGPRDGAHMRGAHDRAPWPDTRRASPRKRPAAPACWIAAVATVTTGITGVSAGLRTCGREVSLAYRASLPRVAPSAIEAFRFHLPLRGSSGFAPDSLLNPPGDSASAGTNEHNIWCSDGEVNTKYQQILETWRCRPRFRRQACGTATSSGHSRRSPGTSHCPPRGGCCSAAASKRRWDGRLCRSGWH